jgi:L-lactate dehydrogenase
MKSKATKVAVVGVGAVGGTFANDLMISGLVREISLIDVDMKKAEGECMDLSHGASFVPPVEINYMGYEGCKGADIVVVTAGASQKVGETRLNVAETNVGLFRKIIPEVTKYSKEAILLIVTNPVDVLTYLTLKLSGLPPNKVIGSGTVLDTSRFRYLIGRHCNVDARNVHAYIIGEHGDSELPVWSNANFGGIHLNKYCMECGLCNHREELNSIFEQVRNAAYRIIECKGATYYAIGLALVRIVEAILRNEHAVLPVSTLIDDYYGVNDICLSVPTIIGENGVEKTLPLKLSQTEQRQFKASAEKIREKINSIVNEEARKNE